MLHYFIISVTRSSYLYSVFDIRNYADYFLCWLLWWSS